MLTSPTLINSYEYKQDRIHRQKRLSAKYQKPVILVSAYLPNELAEKDYANQIFTDALGHVETELKKVQWKCIARHRTHHKLGSDAMLVIDTHDAKLIKKIMMKIEHEHPLGKLMNIDVYNSFGQALSRASCNMPPRKHMFRKSTALFHSNENYFECDEIEKQITVMMDRATTSA
ncbi:citrate lyase holo-[acyl-carrier protein] synthase [Vibrio salinus]|uniref:citrate lyase holo-[acyl-carrier protein] synthase n=1 Tax=Vibrio salinus TaxID=2899784 RepID=UPI001E419FDB|nr:citrate lyase holo-[acyl-carrier protein] synthase [Vibrio salinus]MCE0492797.1 citrate lyase holo-[acyl-carrier protein] synthase [Vibrio salinus]